ncbi:hypothetical protein [Paraglaciecola sp. 20A4]|uniref:hypothetical protein n=1 Tax=Paraglaciecola sp. 20A4 TaxID=2687288 RepID=UPI00140B7EA7|nr:hypothetical protein [Paraglaciecola sp. 20A4]
MLNDALCVSISHHSIPPESIVSSADANSNQIIDTINACASHLNIAIFDLERLMSLRTDL